MGAILQPYNTTAFTDNDFRPPFDARLRAAVDGEDEDGESDRRILNRSATQKWGTSGPSVSGPHDAGVRHRPGRGSLPRGEGQRSGHSVRGPSQPGVARRGGLSAHRTLQSQERG